MIQTFVDADWVSELDFESCQTLDKSFISEHYKETESDLIYRVKFKGSEIYIYILIEFQSTVDHFMALRVLNYITNFYMDYIISNKGVKKLPTVFPIVLYNGDSRWSAPINIKDLIEDYPALGEYGLDFQYFKIAENEYSRDALLKIQNIVSTLFLAESYYDLDLLETELIDLFDAEADKQAVSLFLNWLKQLAVHGRIDQSDYDALETVYRTKEEVKTMLITALEREREQTYQKGKIEGKIEGKVEGKVEGRLEGRIEGKIENAKVMLSKGMDISLISEITSLSENQILQLKSEL